NSTVCTADLPEDRVKISSVGAVQSCSKRHASRGRRAVRGGREPPGGGPRGASEVSGGAHAPRAGASREPVGTRRTAHGACILSDRECMPGGEWRPKELSKRWK